MNSRLISALREAYVKTLLEQGKLYHFDDNAEHQQNCTNFKETFTIEEAAVVNQLTHVLYDEELFRIALRLDKD